jgi:probable HAF family extracellular repeat protein
MKRIPVLALIALGSVACENPTELVRPSELRAPVAAATAAACPGGGITITDLGTLPGDEFSEAGGINNAGQVVGFSGSGGNEIGFLWTASAGMRSIGIPPGGEPGVVVGDLAMDINDQGVVAVTTFSDVSSNDLHAYVWTESAGFQSLGHLPGRFYFFSQANAINDRGEVVGFSGADFGDFAAFIWSQATGIRPLGSLPNGPSILRAQAINNNGVVVVNPEFDLPDVFLWTAESGFRDIGLPPGADFASGTGINDRTEVVGNSGQFGGGVTAFLWTEAAGFLDLGALPGLPRSGATDINEIGQVVGAVGNATGESGRGFVWTAAGGMQELDPLPGGNVSSASAINDSGQVVGTSDHGEGFRTRHAVLWTLGTATTPEAALAGLVDNVEALVGSGALSAAEGHALTVKLEAALSLLERDDTQAGNLVGSFLNQVEALVRSGRLSDANAQSLRDQAACVAAHSASE